MSARSRLQRFKQRDVWFCSSCWGTGCVLSDIDDETGQEYTERCDECDGSGHFDTRTDTAVDGPCFRQACVECNPPEAGRP